MLKINWDLRELRRDGWGLVQRTNKLWSFYGVDSDNISNTKEAIQKQQSNLVFTLNAYKRKANLQNIATSIKKENLSVNYSHFQSALEEAENVAWIFGTYFKNNS